MMRRETVPVLTAQIEKLKICKAILQAEAEKVQKSFSEIDLRINEDMSLSDRQFKRLDEKRGFIKANLDALEYGVLILSANIEERQFTIKMRGEAENADI